MSYGHSASRTGQASCPAAEQPPQAPAGVAYFPPPESRGGWRHLGGMEPAAARAAAGMDLGKLDQLFELQVWKPGRHPATLRTAPLLPCPLRSAPCTA